jgi:leucyl aminopeptidase
VACDTVGLVVGRGTVAKESHAPNTIAAACKDGSSGTFHSDESIDRITVRSTDGAPLTAGHAAAVDVTVWAYRTFSADKVDVFVAADAANPTWSLVSTLTPNAAGAQTLSASFTVPSGGRPAVRAQIRYNGTATACASGGYNDRDDLVFVTK